MKGALTGGSSGIGASVREKLVAAGHRVTAFDRLEPSGPNSRWIPIDLDDPTSIAAAVDAAAAHGPFDALINNAGLPGTPSEVADVVVFLAGPGSAWLKGIDITIDGGMSAMARADAVDDALGLPVATSPVGRRPLRASS